jgi:hypothetical protein
MNCCCTHYVGTSRTFKCTAHGAVPVPRDFHAAVNLWLLSLASRHVSERAAPPPPAAMMEVDGETTTTITTTTTTTITTTTTLTQDGARARAWREGDDSIISFM